jgi:hypothetical protein
MISSSDFTDNSLIGIATVANGRAIITKTLANDLLAEGTDAFTVNIRTGGYNGSIVATSPIISVVDTSVPTITVNAINVNEASPVTFTISSNRRSSLLYWTLNTIGGTINSSDFVGGATSGSFTTDGSGSFSLTLELAPDSTTEDMEGFQLQVRTGSISGSIIATSATVAINDTSQALAPTAQVIASTTNVNEGSTVNFTVNTTNFPAGTLSWDLNQVSGTINTLDFNGGAVTGLINITSSTGSVALTLQNDTTTEGTESFRLRVINGGNVIGISSIITINDTSITPVIPSATAIPSTTSVTEGSTVTFNITSNQPSTMLFWKLNTIGGTINSSDFVGGATSGSFTTNGSGSASISLTTLDEGTVEGSESFEFQVKTGSVDGTIIGTSATVTINDPTPTYSITPSSTSISELTGSCLFTVNTTNVSPGTTLFYGISGTDITSTDFTDNTLTGSFTISGTLANGTASFTKTIQSDTTFEGDETFTATVRTTLNGTIVATSSVITIVDAAYAGGFSSSQVLLAANNSDFEFSGTSFTIEFFVKDAGACELFSIRKDSNPTLATFLKHNGGGTLEYRVVFGTFSNISNTFSAGDLTIANTWIHVAVSYNSSTTIANIYVNGSNVKTTTANANWGNYSFTTLANGFNFFGLNGGSVNGTTSINSGSTTGISNFRFIVGSALYSGATITVPSVPLTSVTGTKLLLLNGRSTSVLSDTNTLPPSKTITSIGTIPKIAGP